MKRESRRRSTLRTGSVAADATARPTTTKTLGDVSSKVLKAVDAIKKPFTQFVKDFASLATSREELAPKFMKAANAWMEETSGTFVDFVRYLVPDVGATRNEYRAHRAYQAADYLRRLVAQQARARREPTTEGTVAPATPMNAMASLVASIMPLIPEDQKHRLWESFYVNLHWSQRQVERLQGLIGDADPLVNIRTPRGQTMPNLRLAVPAPQEEEGAELPRTGTEG